MHHPPISLLLPLLTLLTLATPSPSARAVSAASNHLAARDTPVTAHLDQAICDDDEAQPKGTWDQDTSTAIMCDECGVQWACDMIAARASNQQGQGQAAWPVPSPVQYPIPDNSTDSQVGADAQFHSGDGSLSADGSQTGPDPARGSGA